MAYPGPGLLLLVPEEVAVSLLALEEVTVSLLVPEEVLFSLFALEEVMFSLFVPEEVTVTLLVPEQTRDDRLVVPDVDYYSDAGSRGFRPSPSSCSIRAWSTPDPGYPLPKR